MKCQLCGTPGVRVANGMHACPGCGTALIKDVCDYLSRPRTKISFDKATAAYESLPVAGRVPFGRWLVSRGLELVGKP